MAPQNKPVTLNDLERGGRATASAGSSAFITTGSNTSWGIYVGAWAVLMLVANIMHPPAFVMLIVNAGLLVYNLNAVRTAGTSNVPVWLYILIAVQVLITLQYGWWTSRALF